MQTRAVMFTISKCSCSLTQISGTHVFSILSSIIVFAGTARTWIIVSSYTLESKTVITLKTYISQWIIVENQRYFFCRRKEKEIWSLIIQNLRYMHADSLKWLWKHRREKVTWRTHTRLLFAFSQFEKCHNIVRQPPRTSSSDLRSLHSKPEENRRTNKKQIRQGPCMHL